MSAEIEIKFEIGDEGLEKLRSCGLLNWKAAKAMIQTTVYYDTKGERLRKVGLSLRVRSTAEGFVQTVKHESAASAGFFARGEWEHPVPSIAPDLTILKDVLAEAPVEVGDIKSVAPMIRTEVERRTLAVRQGSSLISVDMDEGTMDAGGARTTIRELELELDEGDTADLLAFSMSLADQVPVKLGVLSKSERGFALAGGKLDRPWKAANINIDAGMSVAEAFSVVVSACLKHYRLNEPLVIQNRDPVALHQARVAMRRLRSAFTLFKTAILNDDYVGLREELRWFTAQLGDARNLDVYLERELPADERPDVLSRREAAYDAACEAMDSKRLRLLLVRLIGWTALGTWRSSRRAQAAIGRYSNKRLDRLWDRIVQAGSAMSEMDEDTRHELRIQIKKLRYGTEFFRGLHSARPKKQKAFLAAVQALQEELGYLNDMATARAMAQERGEDCLINPAAEHEHLVQASSDYEKLVRIGPYWRRINA